MIKLGVARPNSIIQLAEDDYKFVLSEAKRRKLVVSTYSGREDRSLSGVSILWRGMGSHTLIEFVCKEEKVRMEIKTDESKIIYSVKDKSNTDEKNKPDTQTTSEPKANKSDENTCNSKTASTPENANEPDLSRTLQTRKPSSKLGEQ